MMSAQYAEKRKEKAVADYLNGISVVQIAQNVGVSRSTIYTWIRMQKENGLIKQSQHKKKQ
jgi:transposase